MIRPRTNGVLRRHTLERRLFGWMLGLLLVPALILLGAALVVGSQSMQVIGTLGPWHEVGQSGRALFDAAAPAARTDSSLARALDVHQRNLSASLVQARRWAFLGQRANAALPWAILVFALLLGALSLWVSRRIARELARPIEELVGLTEMLGRGESLESDADDAVRERDLIEVRALRRAIHDASSNIANARSRALESERVRAWGEMARRVAHEMKNPLTPLRLAVHRLEGSVADRPAMQEPMEVIRAETARLDELARQFAVLGRPAGGSPSDIDLEELLHALMRTDVPAGIETSVDADEGVPLLRGHYDAIQRAIRNLIRNAVEAVVATKPSDGTVRGHIRGRVKKTASGVRIEIEDTGGGIPDGDIARIFEPDFTLKSGGTGLGLAVVRQAVAAHDGTVTARNGAEGAIFDVELPLTIST